MKRYHSGPNEVWTERWGAVCVDYPGSGWTLTGNWAEFEGKIFVQWVK